MLVELAVLVTKLPPLPGLLANCVVPHLLDVVVDILPGPPRPAGGKLALGQLLGRVGNGTICLPVQHNVPLAVDLGLAAMAVDAVGERHTGIVGVNHRDGRLYVFDGLSWPPLAGDGRQPADVHVHDIVGGELIKRMFLHPESG